eukprot:TRINITY_DN11783_c0_g2_i1.p1 TRINITY_DN11783_c0_g2~~TRINITY_DN11783_c0_g2_i1.p1  ORF type:complete len:261 (+),score=67.68 TRINITY_DN11783_c0_g2_i1:878-1660(+)
MCCRKLLRSPPIERPFKGRIHGLILFPKVFETIKGLPCVAEVELANWSFLELKGNTAKHVKISKGEKDVDQYPTEVGTLSTQATQDAAASKSWQNTYLEETKELGSKMQSKYKDGVYPYLFEMMNNSPEEDTIRLCHIISNTLKQITPEPKCELKVMKPTLKQKDYKIRYNPKLHAKAKRDAMRPVTYQDLEDRKEYIAEKIRIGNEEIAKELQQLSNDPDNRQKKVKVSSIPPEYLRIIQPTSIMKNGTFLRESQPTQS